MNFYDCELCIYSTKFKNDYNRHLNTNKHLNNIIKYGNEEEMLIYLMKILIDYH